MADQIKRVSPEAWNRIFQQDPDGQAILEELFMMFVYPTQLVPGDELSTAANIGKKDLVCYIADKSTE